MRGCLNHDAVAGWRRRSWVCGGSRMKAPSVYLAAALYAVAAAAWNPADGVALSASPAVKAGISASAGIKRVGGRAAFLAHWSQIYPHFARAISLRPLRAQILRRSGRIQRLAGNYAFIHRSGAGWLCRGRLTSAHGTVLSFTDRYRFMPGGLVRMRRRVAVKRAGRGDIGFASGWALFLQGRHPQFYAPGVIYADSTHLPSYAIGADMHQRRNYIREDRLPIPMVMLRNAVTGVTAVLMHTHPTGGSLRRDQTSAVVCNAGLQFGSLGFLRGKREYGSAFLWPGSEGDTTYIGGSHHAWAGRYHPVALNETDRFHLLIRITVTPDFNSAVASAERLGWRSLHPPVYRVNLAHVYALQIALLRHYVRDMHGVEGIPFAVALPSGKISDHSLQIGFVGKQTLNAYQMIRFGLRRHDPALVRQGRAIIHFWVSRSPIPGHSGLFRTWFDAQPHPAWRNYPTYLRVAADGAFGVLLAWSTEAGANHSRPAWMAFCRHFAQWLRRTQRPDGAFYRGFSITNASVLNKSKSSTLDVVHFLVDMYRVSGQIRWLQMARRAGRFGEKAFIHDSQFYGGTVDNPNVQDKEAGTIAMGAFLSLYDATGRKHWLRDAVCAANYAATWIYAWNVPMDTPDPACSFPAGRSTIGLSLIAAGQSGCDIYMAGCWLDFYRLWLFTHDPFFRQVAVVLAYDTKQTMDINGYPAYGYPGLQDEAMTLAVFRWHSVRHWLGWITADQLGPLTQCDRIFGTMHLHQLLKMPLTQQEIRNRTFMRMGGLPHRP